jgi:2-dehydro-3-deoxyglucarate aldolase
MKIDKINKKRIELKNKFNNRKKIFGGWTSIGHPSNTEIIARSNVDFIGIDIEHSTISQDQSQRIIAACHDNEILCLPRVASHNMESIKRLIDSGADGIIMPMVTSAEEVKKLISWTKYPPIGKRSYGIARAQGYGFDFEEYVKNWNDSSILIVQIESINGVKNIQEILSFKEINGVMIGPYDLSGSLNIPGELNHPKVTKAAKQVIQACSKYNKSCGTHIINPSDENIKNALKEGYTFAALASDVFILWNWSKNISSSIKKFR